MTRQMMGHDNSTPTCKGHGIREQASSFAVGRAGVDCQVEVAAGADVYKILRNEFCRQAAIADLLGL